MEGKENSPQKSSHNIVGEPFDGYVYDEIQNRQTNQNSGYDNPLRTPQQLQYLNNQNSWVKLASSVSIDEEIGKARIRSLWKDIPQKQVDPFLGSQLAERAILFNSLSSNKVDRGTDVSSGAFAGYTQRSGVSDSKSIWNDEFAYGLGGSLFGLTPPPGIDSVQVNCLNRGSIKEATVEIKAFNKFQFELIELLYLRLGYIMALEWGNSFYLNGDNVEPLRNTIIENEWFNDSNRNNTNALYKTIDLIGEYRQKYHGNYDGFVGKVVNFKWDFTPEGIYTITLKLITVGDVIESLNINIPTETRKSISNTTNIKESEDATPKINNNAKDILSGWILNNIYKFTNKTSAQQQEDKDYFQLAPNKSNKKTPTQYYIRLGRFLEILEELCVPYIVTDRVTGPPLIDINTVVETNMISYHPGQAPLDPRVCIFKFENLDVNMGGILPLEELQNLPKYIVSDSTSGITSGVLMNLCLNTEFILECLKGNGEITLFNFLKKICGGINKSLGNVNKIEPVLKDERKIFLQDQVPISGLIENVFKDNNDIVPLEIYGYNPTTKSSNFVKNFSFTTQITPELGSMISIGAAATGGSTKGIDATGYAKWNIGLKDRFQPGYDYKKNDEEIEEEDLILWEQNAIKNWNANISTLRGVRKSIFNFFHQMVSSRNLTNAEINSEAFIDDGTAPNGFYLLPDYLKAAKKNNKFQIDITSRENNIQSSYIVHLAECFGANNALIGDNETYTVEKLNSQYLNFDSLFIEQGLPKYKEYLRLLNKKIFNESVKKSQEKNTYKDIYSSGQVGFIPVSLNVTLQGISGVKIYNKLSIDQRFLPPNYPDALHFVITKVNHKIADNEWETDLETISLPITQNKFKVKENGLATYSLALYDNAPLPKEERLPIPSTGRFLIQEERNAVRGRNPINYVPKGEIISVEKVLQDINPDAKDAFKRFLNSLNEKYPGYKMVLSAIGRSFERSAELKKQNPQNSSPGFSKHNYFAAMDFNIIDPNGKNYKKSGYKMDWINSGIVDLAKASGLSWGGEFANYEDDIHFYYDFEIKRAYENAEKIASKENIDITKVDGYKVSLGPILGPQTEAETRNNEFSLNS